MENAKKVLHASTLAGAALLKSGAEIFRVQETMTRIIQHFGYKNYNVYVIANGIFANIDENKDSHRTAIRNVPLSSTNLGIIDRVNSISRDICQDSYDLDEAIRRLEDCQKPPKQRRFLQMLASGIGAAAFGLLYGATLYDGIITFFLGVLLQVFMTYTKNLSKYLQYIGGAFIVTAGAAAAIQLDYFSNFNSIVIGGIMPIFPGIAFTTSIRELFNNDHVSGSVHLLDAVMSAVCIAVGVGVAVALTGTLGGEL